MSEKPTVGIIGAGRAGTAIARVLLRAGVGVELCSTRPPVALRHHLKIYAPGAAAVRPEDIAQTTLRTGPGVTVLAVPQEDLDEVEPEWVAGTVMIDATNRWAEEPLPRWLQAATDELISSSEALAHRFGAAQVVKAWNHLGHHEFTEAADPQLPLGQRRAIALATDDDAARARVMALSVRAGFDPVSLGGLAAGRLMEPDGPIMHRDVRRDDLLRLAR